MIKSIEELEKLYDEVGQATWDKELDHLNEEYRKLIEASPFMALASVGPEGLDCSPRGDERGFVRVVDERMVMIPDRRGNNRIDTLKNIVRDPRVALLFLIPGSNTTFRINGEAHISADADLLASFAVKGKAPRSVIVVSVKAAYFQCGRAIVRSNLWDASSYGDLSDLPSAGEMIAATTGGQQGGKPYDEAWPERAKKSLW